MHKFIFTRVSEFFFLVLPILAVCGASQFMAEDLDGMIVYVQGYDSSGASLICRESPEDLHLVDSEFKDLCFDGGFRAMLCEAGVVVCTENLTQVDLMSEPKL